MEFVEHIHQGSKYLVHYIYNFVYASIQAYEANSTNIHEVENIDISDLGQIWKYPTWFKFGYQIYNISGQVVRL